MGDRQSPSEPEVRRERIETMQNEFAGGPEPGWERMEEAAAAAQIGADTAVEQVSTRNLAESDAPQSGAKPSAAGGTSAVISRGGVVVADEEHPVGVGQQCTKCGTYNEIDARSCRNCEQPLGTQSTAAASPATSATDTEE